MREAAMNDGGANKLQRFRAETNALEQNRMLFDWLRDDDQRAALYAELRNEGFPVLRFKSVARVGGDETWPSEDVYLVSSQRDVAKALQHDSVEPYSSLGSGGRFMLGIDAGPEHTAQRHAALKALHFTDDEIQALVDEAIQRALTLTLKNVEFDFNLVEVAERIAIHFTALLFGLPTPAHPFLTRAMQGAYVRLVFEIIGRHFVPDSGLPAPDNPQALDIAFRLTTLIRKAAKRRVDEGLDDSRLPADTVIMRLAEHDGPTSDELVFVTLGLIAGAIGNFKGAVAIAIDAFFRECDASGEPLIARARALANATEKGWDPAPLEALICDALARRPPAPFLARRSRGAVSFLEEDRREARIPVGARMLLAMGADSGRRLMFGGDLGSPFEHSCVGQHVIRPLIVATVRRVLQLPGLARVVDPGSGDPLPLRKRWGAICESFRLQFRRDRLLNQQPLHVVLPIKPPLAVNRQKLEVLTAAGAHIVEAALRDSKNVHFAWFGFAENGTHLALSTVFDGDFDAYVEFFALKVPLFDEQFELLDVPPINPIRDHPKEFVEIIRKYNRAPLTGYFFSAYPLVDVCAIDGAKLDQR
jgi:hypothetical protein